MTTEKFDLVVKFENSYKKNDNGNVVKDNTLDYELLGIEEIELALRGKDPELYIKESELVNIVLVELGTDSFEAAKELKKSNPKIISSVVPITKVVRTNLLEIVKCLEQLAISDKMEPGDNFVVDMFVLTQHGIESNEILKMVENKLKKMDMNLSEENPKWTINIVIIGDNTGMSIIKFDESKL